MRHCRKMSEQSPLAATTHNDDRGLMIDSNQKKTEDHSKNQSKYLDKEFKEPTKHI